MIFEGVKLLTGEGPVSLQLKDGELTPISSGNADSVRLTFDNALIFPGLVNWHDHLDFNLFPQLGQKFYNNYTDWGAHIHTNYQNEIAAVLKIPLDLRIQWGLFKNLLCGVTTVVNHGERLVIDNAPIDVVQCHSLHSVQFQKQWKLKLNNPRKLKQPVMIHVGEGTDVLSTKEIDQLIHWNLFNRKIVGIHGVGMTGQQAKKFEALVWCPVSNYFLLDRAAPIQQLKRYTAILFGTDSTLTGSWNIWEHIRLARQTKMLTDEELYHSLCLEAGKSWLAKKSVNGNIVVARKSKQDTAWSSFFAIGPADLLLVTNQDRIVLFDEELLSQLTDFDISGFSKIGIDGAFKYVKGNIPELMKQIKAYYRDASFPITCN